MTGVFDLPELVQLLNSENAQEICAISVPKEIQYVDYMVIISGRSVRHCQAIAASVKWFVSMVVNLEWLMKEKF